jgi:hypothetical protein
VGPENPTSGCRLNTFTYFFPRRNDESSA